jgi:hypothetical protein
VNSPLEVTIEQAIEWTKRPRHLEAAIYHAKKAKLQRRPPPPGCRLTLIPGGNATPRRLGLISVLLSKEEWNRGIVPPLTPSEKTAMR